LSKIAAPLTKLTRKKNNMDRRMYCSLCTVKEDINYITNLEDSLRNRRDDYI